MTLPDQQSTKTIGRMSEKLSIERESSIPDLQSSKREGLGRWVQRLIVPVLPPELQEPMNLSNRRLIRASAEPMPQSIAWHWLMENQETAGRTPYDNSAPFDSQVNPRRQTCKSRTRRPLDWQPLTRVSYIRQKWSPVFGCLH